MLSTHSAWISLWTETLHAHVTAHKSFGSCLRVFKLTALRLPSVGGSLGAAPMSRDLITHARSIHHREGRITVVRTHGRNTLSLSFSLAVVS